MKLNKAEQTAFAAIGDAIVKAKAMAKIKKDLLPEVKATIDSHRDEFDAGVTIGRHKFSTITRVELTAIEV